MAINIVKTNLKKCQSRLYFIDLVVYISVQENCIPHHSILLQKYIHNLLDFCTFLSHLNKYFFLFLLLYQIDTFYYLNLFAYYLSIRSRPYHYPYLYTHKMIEAFQFHFHLQYYHGKKLNHIDLWSLSIVLSFLYFRKQSYLQL